MALVNADRVKDTSSTTGTGPWTLAGSPPSGSQGFSKIGDGNSCRYLATSADGAAWEVGICTYSESGPTLARSVVLDSSNGGSAVDFTSTPVTIQTNIPAAFVSPMTAAGDMIYGGANGASARLAAGTASQVLHGGSTPAWGALDLASDVTGALSIANGGTGQTAAAAALNALAPIITYASSGNIITAQIGEAGDTALVIKGAASQTGDLQKWQNSSANTLAAITSSGALKLSNAVGASTTQLRTDGAAKAYCRLTYTGNNTGNSFSLSMDNGGSITDQLTLADNGNAGINLLGTIPAVPWEVNGQIRLWSNSLLPTPIAGTHEYDGKAPYFSPTYGVRGVVHAYQYSKVNASGGVSLNNDANAQSFLPSGKQTFPVQAGIYYRFRAKLLLNLGTTNSRNKQFLFSTTGTFSWIAYTAHTQESDAQLGGGTADFQFHNVATADSFGADSTQQYVYTTIEGEFVMSSAGTVTPKIQFTAAPGGTNTNMRGSYFELTAFGPNASSTGLS